MTATITAITTGLTASVFYGVLTDLVPFLVIMVPVALGIYFLKKLIKGSAKGKVRL